ncbi:MAG TPA: O-antigen ligase family protein [Candidatus Binatia bacterium]|nr:O-antigen ligase family protein [Candidatus Binatia bacterium]
MRDNHARRNDTAAEPPPSCAREAQGLGSMGIHNRENNEKASVLWTVWFCICLIPVVTDDGLSLNYLFMLSPVFVLLARGRVMRPPELVGVLVVLFSAIFLIASAYQVRWLDLGLRRLSSFLVFLSMFTFCLISVTPAVRKSFLYAVVLVSVWFSLQALVSYVVLGPEALAFTAKDKIGTQRIGFLYLLALWIAAFRVVQRGKARTQLLPLLVIALLVVGLFLTFSRSSIVALAASVFVFTGYALITARLSLRNLFVFVLLPVAALGAASAAVLHYFPIVASFYDERLLLFFVSGEVLENLEWAESSEGTRLVIWGRILEFVSDNPFTGTGYLGVWAIYGEGSSHNQYMDTVLRLGLIGAAAYFFLLFRLVQFLYRYHKGLFFGMVGVLVYGLFHETFKESQGAFAFAFLVGMFATNLRALSTARIDAVARGATRLTLNNVPA